MSYIKIIEIEEMNLRGAYVLDGFPSIGLVGSIVANYIVSALGLRQIAVVDSDTFPAVSMIKNGVPNSPVRLYAGHLGEDGDRLVVFVSEFQPPPHVIKELGKAIMSVYEGITHIQHVSSETVLGDPTAAYIVLAISALIEGTSFTIAVRQFMKAKGEAGAFQFLRHSKDPSLYTVVLEDSAALLGLIFAFLGIFLGHALNNPYLDGVASVAIGLLLMSVAWFLASRTAGLLLGEGVSPEELADIRRRVEADPAVRRAGDILTMYMGPHELLVNMGVCFVEGTTAEQMHEAIRRIEADLKNGYPQTNRVYIEAESLPGVGTKGSPVCAATDVPSGPKD